MSKMTTKTYFQTTLENKSIYPLLHNSDKKGCRKSS